jgi:hypothetical protein
MFLATALNDFAILIQELSIFKIASNKSSDSTKIPAYESSMRG